MSQVIQRDFEIIEEIEQIRKEVKKIIEEDETKYKEAKKMKIKEKEEDEQKNKCDICGNPKTEICTLKVCPHTFCRKKCIESYVQRKTKMSNL
ncbi:ubiquitin ligase protein chfr [Anaeramoeba ignava]|uniref:Ubiquitin ligase protein chfr n=1 Tax=Anaeramoeba ignava TaxID=1746090 RepID=A0A9Q0M066_ANAIG|nr:ubiquitin ligase protein chfr [Anaeramoeba ignava]